MRSTRFLTPAILLFLVAGSARGAEVVHRSVTSRTEVISFPSDSTRFNLSGRWIRPGSLVAIFEAETLRAGSDYEIESTEGILHLLHPLPAGHLRLRYEIVPIAIGRVFQVSIPVDTSRAGEAPIPPKTGRPLDALASRAARLDIRGSKTVSLEFGTTQDLTVRQSLDVSLSGEIVPEVTVRGVLSDRQTPLQPEGNTTELSDLDRLFLEVQGPGASMTLGDFQLRGPAGLFTGYERQLQGVRLQGTRGEGKLSLAAASVPGVYTTVEFLGEEGKQGPYLLRPSGTAFDAVVIAGSERVWLDGELLVRGEDRDYLVDYAASTLTFTGRRVIGHASRITIDFQLSSQAYRRNAYAAEAGWGAAGSQDANGFGMRATYLSERDDRSRPIGGPLTAREKEILAQAGDTARVDLGSGVDCGAAGHGDYIWVEADSLHAPFLRFVGDSLGTCKVRFDDVGDRQGDYADSLLPDRTIYHYVGVKRGRFLPGRAVPRPENHDVLDLVGFYSAPAGFRFEMEGAGSIDDPNTYSKIGNSDHHGGALSLRLSRDPGALRVAGIGLGRWGIRLESRDVEARFHPLGRIDAGWLGYDWGVASNRLMGGDRRRSVSVRNEPGLGFAVEGGFETISNRHDLDGERTRMSLRRVGRLVGSLEHTRVGTKDSASGVSIDGARRVDAGMLGLRLTRAETSFSLRSEENRQGSGETRTGAGFQEWSASAAWLLPEQRGRFELSRTDRHDHDLTGLVRTSSVRSRTYETHAAYAPTGRVLDARYSRRDLFLPDGGTSRSDVAGILWSQEEGGGRFGQQIRADLTTSQQDGKQKVIQFAGPGRGRYDSLGVYVGTGDYDVVLIPNGTSSLERRLDASWRVELAPGRGPTGGSPAEGAFARLWSTSQWILYGNFAARTAGSASQFWNDLPSLLLGRKEGVPLAQHRIRAEASALPQARWASPQLRLERERTASRAYQNVQSEAIRDLVAATLRSNPTPKWTIEQEVQIDRDIQKTHIVGQTGATGSRGTTGWSSSHLRLGGWVRPASGWTLRLGALGRLRDRGNGLEQYHIYRVTPGVQWVAGKGTRFDVQGTRTWVVGPTATFYGLETKGWEGRGNVAVRLRASLDATGTWDLRTTSAGRVQNSVQVELRATF